MTREEMAVIMDKVFEECRLLRGAGQKEYARREENAFANFERVAERLKLSREKVLLVYMEKHLDGIHSWIDGHKSQRESVVGRINDAVVYLCLLRGMHDEAQAPGFAQLEPVSELCQHGEGDTNYAKVCRNPAMWIIDGKRTCERHARTEDQIEQQYPKLI